MFNVLAGGRDDSQEQDGDADAEERQTDHRQEKRRATDDTVVGLGDGCSYKISTHWFTKLGLPIVDKISKILSAGGSTHFEIIDDGVIIRVVFFSYIVYMDREVQKGMLAATLWRALFAGHEKERERCRGTWDRVRQRNRTDVAAAAMKMGVLRELAFRVLRGEDDAAEICMSFSSPRIHWMASRPQEAIIQLDEALRRVADMHRAAGRRNSTGHAGKMEGNDREAPQARSV